MAESLAAPAEDVPQQPPVVVKKYANRRLYNTETSSYITLENLADMIRAGRDFVVYDAKSSEDITRGVLTQIIVEEESKGTSMLPTNFLRQLIGFYGDSLQGVVPRYLESAMSNFARQQAQMRQVVQNTFSPFLPLGVEEMGRQNIALMERAMAMFNPLFQPTSRPDGSPLPPQLSPPDATATPTPASEAAPSSHAASSHAASPHTASPELEALRHEVDSLRAQLAIARAEAVIQHAPAATMAAMPSPAPSGPAPSGPAPSGPAPSVPAPSVLASSVSPIFTTKPEPAQSTASEAPVAALALRRPMRSAKKPN